MPDWLADKLAAAGFFHLLTGQEYGGLGADPVTAARVIETLSTASPSVGWVTMILASSLSGRYEWRRRRYGGQCSPR